MQVMITANAAYTEFTNKEVVMLVVAENDVKQLDQNVMNKRLSSILKKAINISIRSENSDNFL